LQKGNKVYGIDNFATGSMQNLAHILGHERMTFVNGDILNRELMAELISEVDIIYHLAAAVGVKYIIENTLKAIQTNIYGTDTVLELAAMDKKKVMIASSSEVYGKNGKVPYREDGDRLLGPTTLARWSYACAKTLDEFMSLAYFKEQGLPVVIVRFFNTCGPRQTGKYGMVIPRFVKNALMGIPLIVHGDGTQTRCFTYVGDAIRAITTLMETEEAVGEIFNVGNIEEIQIIDLARKIIELTGSSSEIQCISYEEAFGEGFVDMKRRVPDISKVSNLIGWRPEVDLDKLLKMIIAYYSGEVQDVRS